MAWLRIDDRVRTHPKIVQAGPAAAWLWFCGICYCREHLTDGFLAFGIMPTLAPGLSGWKALARKLVAAGLWHEVEQGFQVHDFLDWNPTRASVLAARDQDRARKRGAESGRHFQPESVRNPDGIQTESERIPSGFQTTASRAGAGDAGLGSHRESISGSLEGGVGEGSRSMAPALTGALPRDHMHHAFCGRFCVTQRTFSELVRQYGDGGEAAVEGFLSRLSASLGPDESHGGHLWMVRHFEAWLVECGRVKPAPVAAAAITRPVSAIERFRQSQAARGAE